jgi:DNA repair protein RecO (recombination protein O)
MILSTRGIVLQYLNYSESSIIVKIFTEELGLQSYIVKGIRSKRSKSRLALFQPLTLLDLIVYHKENKTLHHIKEQKVSFAYHSMPVDITKRSIVFFLDEILFRSIRVETPDKPLFEWLFNALTWLDLSENNIVNYHLVFMIQLSRFLGFFPKMIPGKRPKYFDLQEGEFIEFEPPHSAYVSGELVVTLQLFTSSTFDESSRIEISNETRRKLLDILVTYYQLHLPGFGEIKSLEVLKAIV